MVTTMASGENTAEERRDERRDYLAQRFPRVSPARLPIGQLSGFEEPPGAPMRLFAPGPRALEAFRQLWNDEEGLPLRLELECGHPLPNDPPDHMVLRVACETCGTDVRLHLVEAL
jgi:hypothetical protein